MGDIVGGLIGGIGSLFSQQGAKSSDLTGFNYLTGQNGTQPIVNTGVNANTTAGALLNGTANGQQTSAFNNYLNSTGYQFQNQQGQNAIGGSAAARGILNSGSTAKALDTFGNNIASTNFNNYIGQLGGLTGSGLTASGQIGQAGTTGGVAAGNQQANPSSPTQQGLGALSSLATNVFGGI